MKVYIIIPAGGTGSRMYSKNILPKQFMKLNNKAVISYSLKECSMQKEIIELYIAADKKYFELLHRIIHSLNIKRPVTLVQSGRSRFESVKNAFMSIEGAEANDIVVVHDAARPNISCRMIRDIISECEKNDAVIYGIRAFETVKELKGNTVKRTVDRSDLWMIQTPQAFKYHVLNKAYSKVKSRKDITDEAMLCEIAGFNVKLIEGRRDNIKITTDEDMNMIKKIMK
jgi:2-C-methyl-D-erythritol 4-phosphate cytidylyltransferase